MNAKIVTNAPHCIWRNGQPRFVPGPRLRRLGFAGKDLKHPNGKWFDSIETQNFAFDICDQANQRDDTSKTGKRLPPVPAPDIYTIGQMIADLFDRPDYNNKSVVEGKKIRKPLKPDTVRTYKGTSKVIQEVCQDIWVTPPEKINTAIAEGVLNTIEVQRGQAQAIHARSLLRTAYKKTKQAYNPFMGLDLPGLAPRTVDISWQDIAHFIKTCDDHGKPEFADMIYLGIFTAQRQKDRFALNLSDLQQDRLTLSQSKTAAPIDIELLPMLQRRFAQTRIRRNNMRVNWPQLIIDETTSRPFRANKTYYRREFARLRKLAAVDCPALADLRDEDLRKVAMTWMHSAGATDSEAAAVSGHAETSMAQMKRHYVHKNANMADNATKKLAVWLEQQGAML